MNNWIVVPTILPAMTAALLVLGLRHDLARQRVVSIAAILLLAAISIGLYILSSDGEPRVYRLGAWPAPFGIVLVLDRLSASLLVLTAFLALAVAVFAAGGLDARGRHFHPLLQFQLLGINGAFLTGDVFNLFVFFEVMLIASYGLMLHGGGAPRLKAGFQYVAINLIASTLFLFAVGLIYAVTGTLNMADLARKVAQVSPADQALLKTGALLLFLVFATKAALVPLHWWLPVTYKATSAAVAALFMIMTKVGAYAILRVYSLIFGAEAGPLAGAAAPVILPLALITLVVGAVGMLASRTMRDLICFSVIASMGTLLVAISTFDVGGVTAALYYLVHSTLVGAALFLLAELVSERRGNRYDLLEPSSDMQDRLLYAGLFFLAAIALAGMPPLSGFMGKLMVLESTRTAPHVVAIWTTVLATSFLVLIAIARAGSVVFWKSLDGSKPDEGEVAPFRIVPVCVVALLLGGTAALAIGAGPVTEALEATARQLLTPKSYIGAVLGTEAGMLELGR